MSNIRKFLFNSVFSLSLFYILRLLFFSFICFVSYRFLLRVCLGEHPAAMQRGCANANIDMSIVVYIVTLSMLLQQLNRITHGYGVSYDVIRWIKSIAPETMASSFHCKQIDQHPNSSDCSSPVTSHRCSSEMLAATIEYPHIVNNECIRCIVRWKPFSNKLLLTTHPW